MSNELLIEPFASNFRTASDRATKNHVQELRDYDVGTILMDGRSPLSARASSQGNKGGIQRIL